MAAAPSKRLIAVWVVSLGEINIIKKKFVLGKIFQSTHHKGCYWFIIQSGVGSDYNPNIPEWEVL